MKPRWMLSPLLVIALAMCFHEGLGIRCWDCSSDTDAQCADPFDNSTVALTDCNMKPKLPHLPDVNSTICRKTRQQVNGKLRILRGCGYLTDRSISESGKSCFTQTGTHKIVMEYCTCNTTACNTGFMTYHNQLVTVLSTILTYTVSRF